MNLPQHQPSGDHVEVVNPLGKSPVVLVCEHASNHIPREFDNLGLVGDALQSHAVWDPGAMAVAQGLARRLDAIVVASGVSRLVYDCNRPPHADDAMPAQSEVVAVPGNCGLTSAQRADRAARFYEPFKARLSEIVASKTAPVIVTIHSFTPVFHGKTRDVEIGVLHDADTRLADAMLNIAADHTASKTMRNQPYGPENGVTHTLCEHAIGAGHLNVMLEIRNDLIATADQQENIAASIADWLTDALARLATKERTACQV